MNIVKAEITRMLKSLILWAVILIAIDTLFMSFYPSMKSSGMSELMKTKLDMIPQTMQKSLGIGSFADLSDLLQYFAYCWQYLMIAVCIFAAILGANTLIKEETDGTIEFLYAKPVSRTEIALCKILANFFTLLFLNLVLFGVNAAILAVLRNSGYSFWGGLAKISLTSFYACAAFFAIGFACSALLRRASQASPAAMGIFFTTYIFGILAPIVKNQEFMQYLSPYHYVQPADILKSGTLKTSYAVILAALIIAGLFTGTAVYRKKDMRL